MFRKYCFLLLFFVMRFCFSQGDDYIFGQLIDSTRSEPIAFASIRVKDRALGVITNMDGTFKIPLRYRSLGEVIEISCMGYISKALSIKDLSKEHSNIIVLRPGGFQLSEAVVSAKIKRLGAKQIVRIAVNDIPRNHPTENFEIVGYYRDYQVKNGNYANLSEAIINVQDVGFDTQNILNNQYQIYSYNQNLDFEIDSFARQPYDYKGWNKIVPGAKMKNDGGNEFIMLRMHDAIRNYGLESFSFIDSISSDFINNHKFQIVRKTNYNKEVVYEIDLAYKNDHYRAEGKIFINTDDFAIHKLDYSVFKRKQPLHYDIAENTKERFTDGFKKMKREMLYHIQIEYVRGAGKSMFLNYISFYNKVLLQRPALFKSRFAVNLNDKSFRIRLNKIPEKPDEIRISDFRITHKNGLIPLKEFYFLEDERTFIVRPHLSNKKRAKTFEDLFTENNGHQVSDLKYAYRNIKDSLGNKLDERKWEYIHQYREFFAQETKLRSGAKFDDKGLMVKGLPLESRCQPMVEKGRENEYWKNTPPLPLKN